MSLEGKVVIITGASSGIGRETAVALGYQKCCLVLAARRLEKLEETARRVEAAGGKVLIAPTDVSKRDDIEQLMEKTLVRFNRIDVLINNAGSGLLASVEETTPEQMERLWRTNFFSTFLAIRAVLPVMKKQGAGQIITVCSMAGRRGTPLNSAYCASKFAQAGFLESLRVELRDTPVRSTVIYPGPTETEFLAALENPQNRVARYHGHVQHPGEVASEIVKALRRPKAEIIAQRFGRLVLVMQSLSPSAVDWIVVRFLKRKWLQKKNH